MRIVANVVCQFPRAYKYHPAHWHRRQPLAQFIVLSSNNAADEHNFLDTPCCTQSASQFNAQARPR